MALELGLLLMRHLSPFGEFLLVVSYHGRAKLLLLQNALELELHEA